jgi:hypothetical protein
MGKFRSGRLLLGCKFSGNRRPSMGLTSYAKVSMVRFFASPDGKLVPEFTNAPENERSQMHDPGHRIQEI